jgi:Ca2+-dependent lipid-binding protein
VLEVQLSRGYDLMPKDSNGLSDPYVLVKYGTRIMFRSKVVKESLNPEWNQVASLVAPAAEDVILVVS